MKEEWGLLEARQGYASAAKDERQPRQRQPKPQAPDGRGMKMRRKLT